MWYSAFADDERHHENPRRDMHDRDQHRAVVAVVRVQELDGRSVERGAFAGRLDIREDGVVELVSSGQAVPVDPAEHRIKQRDEEALEQRHLAFHRVNAAHQRDMDENEHVPRCIDRRAGSYELLDKFVDVHGGVQAFLTQRLPSCCQ